MDGAGLEPAVAAGRADITGGSGATSAGGAGVDETDTSTPSVGSSYKLPGDSSPGRPVCPSPLAEAVGPMADGSSEN